MVECRKKMHKSLLNLLLSKEILFDTVYNGYLSPCVILYRCTHELSLNQTNPINIELYKVIKNIFNFSKKTFK